MKLKPGEGISVRKRKIWTPTLDRMVSNKVIKWKMGEAMLPKWVIGRIREDNVQTVKLHILLAQTDDSCFVPLLLYPSASSPSYSLS